MKLIIPKTSTIINPGLEATKALREEVPSMTEKEEEVHSMAEIEEEVHSIPEIEEEVHSMPEIEEEVHSKQIEVRAGITVATDREIKAEISAKTDKAKVDRMNQLILCLRKQEMMLQ